MTAKNDETQPRVVDMTKDGKCSLCGECCTNILLATDAEVHNVKEYVKKHNIKPTNWNVKTATSVLGLARREASNVCPFLGEDKLCKIYKSRFSLCRRFDCAKQEVVDNGLPYHLGVRAIDALSTFFPDEYNPNPPDLSVLNDKLRQKENAYRRI